MLFKGSVFKNAVLLADYLLFDFLMKHRVLWLF